MPLSVESCLKISVLRRAFILPSSVLPCIKLSVFRRAFRPLSSSPSSAKRSVLRRPFQFIHSAIRLTLSVESFVNFSVFRLPLVAPSCVT